ncbi:hypothetical protein IMZ48_08665 [Candidatus Bathyarchaeota archaeon]|nr:hypothetical protein [Candidatus Bathyarchaeota archaeon]
MASKKDKLSYIQSLTPEEILKLIPHDVMNNVVFKATAYLDNVSDGHIVNSAHAATPSHLNVVGTKPTEVGKAMRPLNAFIAFRSKF